MILVILAEMIMQLDYDEGDDDVKEEDNGYSATTIR